MRKILSAILSMIMLCTMTGSAFAENNGSSGLLPSESEWASEYVKKAQNAGITENNKGYHYLTNITRTDFCELIYNYTDIVGVHIDDCAVPFSDIQSDAVSALYTMGIVYGKSETEFAPNALLTREEAATIIFRLISTVHPDSAATELWFEFSDSEDISDWAMDNIQRICNMGIMHGVGDGRFAPKNNLTVEQAIAMLVRIYDKFNAATSVGIIGGADGPTAIFIGDEAEFPFEDFLNIQMPDDKNYMFSPLSIKMALALAANGADGETRSEILTALGIKSLDEFNELSKSLIERYSKTDILSLNIANSIWINKDKTSQNFSDAFKAVASSYYNADAGTVDNENAADKINSWVSDKTNGKIEEITEDSDDFGAMLVNAIYFSGKWQNEFNEVLTKPDEFISADGTKKQIDFMNKTAWLDYAETESSKIISLPYQNRADKFSDDGEYIDTEHYPDLDVSMYMILTDNDISVAGELESAIEENAFERTYIKLSMPKFKIEYSEKLNDMLKNIGIKTAFGDDADFSDMFDSKSMSITDILHKTFITVDEKGTEAAAVTAIGMAGSSLPPEPTELKYNKPFYFAIRDNQSGEILFMGRYAFAE